jgi:hypothetical protein
MANELLGRQLAGLSSAKSSTKLQNHTHSVHEDNYWNASVDSTRSYELHGHNNEAS